MLHFRRSSAGRSRLASVVLTVLVGTMLIPATPVLAAEPTDMVLEWNVNAVNAINNAPTATPPGLGQPPPLAPIQLAIVHTAVYDAVNAIAGTHEPYIDGLSAPATASQAAAAATAAHHVLVGLVPASAPQVKASLDHLYYDVSLPKIPDGDDKTAGIQVGAEAAAAMLANRTGDGRFGSRTFVVGTAPGEWRPVPPLGNNVFAWVADVKPFALRTQAQFLTAGPPALKSAQYAAEFNEVKAVGGSSSTRTEDQAKLAAFVSGNPFGLLNRAFREISTARRLSTAEQARFFALTSMSTGDAAISCWSSKVRWNFWRPQTAIQNAATDGNDATTADPGWTSLISTPGYPDNASGYNCIAASAMYSAKEFFGTDTVSFSLTNVTPTATLTRNYSRFSDFVTDAIEGRILVGLHFRSADVQGALLGQKVAEWIESHYLEPVN